MFGSGVLRPPMCPMCNLSLTDPRRLNCGHDVCLTCVDSCLTQGKEAQSDRKWETVSMVTCPECEEVTTLSPEQRPLDLPRSILLHPLYFTTRDVTARNDVTITRCQGLHHVGNHGNAHGDISSLESLLDSYHDNAPETGGYQGDFAWMASIHGNLLQLEGGVRYHGVDKATEEWASNQEYRLRDDADSQGSLGSRSELSDWTLSNSGSSCRTKIVWPDIRLNLSSSSSSFSEDTHISMASTDSAGGGSRSSAGGTLLYTDIDGMRTPQPSVSSSQRSISSMSKDVTGRRESSENYCQDCRLFLCDVCTVVHVTSTGGQHCIASVTENLLQSCCCGEPVTRFCRGCRQCTCTSCALGNHGNHDVIAMVDAEQQARRKVERFIRVMSRYRAEDVGHKIEERLAALSKAEEEVTNTLDSAIAAVTSLNSALKRSRDEVRGRVGEERAGLEEWGAGYQALQELIPGVVQHARGLQASRGQGMVSEAARLPDPQDYTRLSPPGVWLPTLPRGVEGIPGTVRALQVGVTLRYTWGYRPPRRFSPKPPLSNITPVMSVTLPRASVCGATFHTGTGNVIVRTNDTNLPIKVYDVNGNLDNQMSGGVGGSGGVAYDSNRDLILAPNTERLITMDMEGFVKDVFKVKDAFMRSVTFCPDDDLYAATDIANNRVLCFDPRSGNVVRSWTTGGSNPTQINRPYHISSSQVKGQSSLVISDWGTHSIRVFNIKGDLCREYTDRDDDLSYPWDLAVDPAGRILVADRFNKRVISYYGNSEGRHDVIDADIAGHPHYLSVDVGSRSLLAVSSKQEFGEANIIQVFRESLM